MLSITDRLEPFHIRLLAPAEAQHHLSKFRSAQIARQEHRSWLTRVQQFRGRVYVEDGFLRMDHLDRMLRHISRLDVHRWHVLICDQQDQIKACAGVCFHVHEAPLEEVKVYELVTRAVPPPFAPTYREALTRLRNVARRENRLFVEAGGWAVDHDVRNRVVALTTVLASWALIVDIGEAVGVAAAGRGNPAAQILLRLGASPLSLDDEPLPWFYDAGYQSDLQIVTFDSRAPNLRYAPAIDDLRGHLMNVPTFAAAV